MKNTFYFILKALFFLKLFKFLSFFVHVGKRLDKKAKVNFKIYDVKTWEKYNFNAHISQYLMKLKQSGIEIWSVNRI